MISSAFKSASIEATSQQTQGINTITQGVKDLATAIIGVMGFSGALGPTVSKGAQHALAGRVGGVGGNLMLATLQQKKATAEAASQISKSIEIDQAQQIEASKTVFETLINKRGKIESSLGEIDPASELGEKIKAEVNKDDNDR